MVRRGRHEGELHRKRESTEAQAENSLHPRVLILGWKALRLRLPSLRQQRTEAALEPAPARVGVLRCGRAAEPCPGSPALRPVGHLEPCLLLDCQLEVAKVTF